MVLPPSRLALSGRECQQRRGCAILTDVPTYEYKCAEGHITEAFQKMTDPPLKKCGVCGKKVERVLFAPTIHYNGSGFYSTDYGKGGKKAKPKAESTGGETKKDAGESKKSDSKAASTASD